MQLFNLYSMFFLFFYLYLAVLYIRFFKRIIVFYKNAPENEQEHTITTYEKVKNIFLAIFDSIGHRPRKLQSFLHIIILFSLFFTIASSIELMFDMLAFSNKDTLFTSINTTELFFAYSGILASIALIFLKAHNKRVRSFSDVSILGLIILTLLSLCIYAEMQNVFFASAHVLIICIFLAYMLKSSHTHIVFAPIYLINNNLNSRPKLTFADIYNEECEEFGLNKVSQLTKNDILASLACMKCGRCQENCPAYKAKNNLEVKDLQSANNYLSPLELMQSIKNIIYEYIAVKKTTDEIFDPILFSASDDEKNHKIKSLDAQILWDCATCRNCEIACPIGVRHLDIIIEARKYQCLNLAKTPRNLTRMQNNLEQYQNPFINKIENDALYKKESSSINSESLDKSVDIISSSFVLSNEIGQEILSDFAAILKSANIKHTIISDTFSLGDEAKMIGNDYLAQTLIDKNKEILSKLQNDFVSICPHTISCLKDDYDIKNSSMHHSQYLLNLLNISMIKPAKVKAEKITFHDPCYLSKWLNIDSEIRLLLQKFNNDTPIIEARTNHKNSLCCGGGGGLLFNDDISKDIARSRLNELFATGAEIIITACPICNQMLNSHKYSFENNEHIENIKIIDISNFVLARLAHNTIE